MDQPEKPKLTIQDLQKELLQIYLRNPLYSDAVDIAYMNVLSYVLRNNQTYFDNPAFYLAKDEVYGPEDVEQIIADYVGNVDLISLINDAAECQAQVDDVTHNLELLVNNGHKIIPGSVRLTTDGEAWWLIALIKR